MSGRDTSACGVIGSVVIMCLMVVAVSCSTPASDGVQNASGPTSSIQTASEEVLDSERLWRLSCRIDTDCDITCQPEKRCCGELCECSDVVNITWGREVNVWRRENCKEADCPVADCDVPKFDHKAVCVEGLCQVEKTDFKRTE